ncbi:hypothetical protein KSE_75365 [Kitasatospora setae KM-6054]|uniref:DUF4158 domain-containing protein n=1 Tax=Kitasatospora setae (strain ATCC 33774 / DSM 43861 / JCM 3304 / KCC A-0304 / NBRC 14216 / KM-6054) TaxID=452652 RepID=E4NJZ0_KITSK|nr:DUF4158 domain-containing protein [Kitasatospora setae]BAJ33288.1 hypothetical protein KSE_75365 [Kitasatospora setae KM-6054]
MRDRPDRRRKEGTAPRRAARGSLAHRAPAAPRTRTRATGDPPDGRPDGAPVSRPRPRSRGSIEPKRRVHNRLGFAVQMTTVRFLGVLLDVPTEAVDYLAEQLGVDDGGQDGAPADRLRPAGGKSCCLMSGCGTVPARVAASGPVGEAGAVWSR